MCGVWFGGWSDGTGAKAVCAVRTTCHIFGERAQWSLAFACPQLPSLSRLLCASLADEKLAAPDGVGAQSALAAFR